MRIAILGAGFSGLATTWHLLKQKNAEIVVFDPVGIGGQTSGIAAGLLHPYAGVHAKQNKNGYEGLQATLELLEVASNELGRPVTKNTGLLRVAIYYSQTFFSSSKSADWTLMSNSCITFKSFS